MNGKPSHPPPTSIADAVDRWASERGDAEAVVASDRRVTWRGLADEAERVARGLVAAGVSRGDRVAMVGTACVEYVCLAVAAAKVGGVFLGLNPKFTPEEIRGLLAHAEPALLVTPGDSPGADLAAHRAAVPSIRAVVVIGPTTPPGCVAWREFLAADRPELAGEVARRRADIGPEDPALLLYTSGSTGRPKGVLHGHRAVAASVALELEHMRMTVGDRLLLHFPINHVAAAVEITAAGLIGGCTLVLMDRFDPERSLEVIERERITMVGQVPVMYLMQMQTERFRTVDWRHVRSFVWGGSKAPAPMLAPLGRIAATTGARLATAYGSTELCGFTTFTAPDDPPEALATTCGRVAPPLELRIVDEAGRPVPAGMVGEVAFRGPVVMQGYYRDPEATARAIDAEGWFHSGDLGSLDAGGRLRLAGRRSEMFKTGGENVHPQEVEDVLEAHPDVLFAAVLGVPDPIYDEVGHAFVMPKPGRQPDAAALRDHCRAHLVNFKVPKLLDVRPILPLLANGKVDKRALRADLGASAPSERRPAGGGTHD